ncbi:hypothetical protein GGR55DRAFT_702888 [Xylaria sp. FL0064]|nr:hypothetical protein GGR55DRAFT_702888 [Xylaria sp. FL0064]
MSSNVNSEDGQGDTALGNSSPSIQRSVPDPVHRDASSMVEVARNEPETVTDIGVWSELAKYITAFRPDALARVGSDASIKVHLNCEICHDKLVKLPGWIRGDVSYTDENSEALCVLPCGHFFGVECIRTWVRKQCENDNTVPLCPKCRFRLVYPDCRCPLELIETPTLDENSNEDITEHVLYTRVHELLPGQEIKFVDISTWDPTLVDHEHNYGVSGSCEQCMWDADSMRSFTEQPEGLESQDDRD